MSDKAGPPVLFGKKNGDHVMIQSSNKVVGGWVETQIDVRCGGLSALFTGRFKHGELRKLGEDLEDVYNGRRFTAGLKPTEAYLVLLLTNDEHGRVHLTGEARQKLDTNNVLAFELQIDQEDLQFVANALILADRGA